MTENELLEELKKELSVPEIDSKSEITASMLAKELGITERNALYYLKKMENEGKLKSRLVKGKQSKRLAFSKVETK